MTQQGTIKKILPGGMAEIEVTRRSACGHDCAKCGGCGGLEDDRYAVGYVSGAKGYKVAGSIKDFLEMAIYYPCWREVARCIRQNLPYSIANLLEAYEESHPQTEQDRKQLSKQLSLSHNPRSMDLLAVCLKKQDDFLVYASRQEAEDTNLFRS